MAFTIIKYNALQVGRGLAVVELQPLDQLSAEIGKL